MSGMRFVTMKDIKETLLHDGGDAGVLAELHEMFVAQFRDALGEPVVAYDRCRPGYVPISDVGLASDPWTFEDAFIATIEGPDLETADRLGLECEDEECDCSHCMPVTTVNGKSVDEYIGSLHRAHEQSMKPAAMDPIGIADAEESQRGADLLDRAREEPQDDEEYDPCYDSREDSYYYDKPRDLDSLGRHFDDEPSRPTYDTTLEDYLERRLTEVLDGAFNRWYSARGGARTDWCRNFYRDTFHARNREAYAKRYFRGWISEWETDEVLWDQKTGRPDFSYEDQERLERAARPCTRPDASAYKNNREFLSGRRHSAAGGYRRKKDDGGIKLAGVGDGTRHYKGAQWAKGDVRARRERKFLERERSFVA